MRFSLSVEERFWDFFFQAWMHRWILVRSRFAICFCIRKNNLINYYHPIFTFFHCCDNKYFFSFTCRLTLKMISAGARIFSRAFSRIATFEQELKAKINFSGPMNISQFMQEVLTNPVKVLWNWIWGKKIKDGTGFFGSM